MTTTKSDERTTIGNINDRHLDYKTIAIGACSFLLLIFSGLFAIAQDGIKELKDGKADKPVVEEQFKSVQIQLKNIENSVNDLKQNLHTRDRELLEAIKSLKDDR